MSKSEDAADSAERLFLEHLGFIRRAAEVVTYRSGLSPEEVDDFKSWVTLKAIEDDYAVLRRHRGESSLKTYLAVVVSRLFHDYHRDRMGRWRPSAAAARLGPLAARLETLVYRDGYTLSEAAEVLRTSEPDLPETQQLARLLEQLPRRAPHRLIQAPLSQAAPVAGPDQADDLLRAAEIKRQRARVQITLTRALGELPPEDRIVVELHFLKGLSLGDVARALGLPQKPLYRRVERIRRDLRQQLETEGVDAAIVHEALAGYADS